MAYRYRVKTKRSGIDKSKVLYYAVPVRQQKVTLEALAKELSGRCSLTEGDIHSTLIGLAELTEEHLHAGDSVCLDRLGVFSLSASSEGFASPRECKPSKVKAKKICFRAAPELRKGLKFVKFERDSRESWGDG